MIRTALIYTQWEVIAPHCLGRESTPGGTNPDPRLFVGAVLWIARTGGPWRDLPDATDGAAWKDTIEQPTTLRSYDDAMGKAPDPVVEAAFKAVRKNTTREHQRIDAGPPLELTYIRTIGISSQ